MRISDWSSDVCSSDLLVDQQLALLFVQVGDLGEVLGGGGQDQPGVLGVVHQLHEAKLHATDRQRVAAQLVVQCEHLIKLAFPVPIGYRIAQINQTLRACPCLLHRCPLCA